VDFFKSKLKHATFAYLFSRRWFEVKLLTKWSKNLATHIDIFAT